MSRPGITHLNVTSAASSFTSIPKAGGGRIKVKYYERRHPVRMSARHSVSSARLSSGLRGLAKARLRTTCCAPTAWGVKPMFAWDVHSMYNHYRAQSMPGQHHSKPSAGLAVSQVADTTRRRLRVAVIALERRVKEFDTRVWWFHRTGL